MTVSQDFSSKHKVEKPGESLTLTIPAKGDTRVRVLRRDRIIWGCAPPQSVPVGGRLSQFVEGWKHITNYPYILSIVKQGYRLRFMSPPLLCKSSWNMQYPQWQKQAQGFAGAVIPDATKQCNIRGTTRHSGILLQCISGAQSIRRVVSCYQSEKVKCSPRHTSLSHVYYCLSSEYCKKQRLHIQNRSGGCILSCTDLPGHSEVPSLRLQEGVPVSGTSFDLSTAPQVFTHLGHTVVGYLPLSRHINVTLPRACISKLSLWHSVQVYNKILTIKNPFTNEPPTTVSGSYRYLIVD